MTQAQTEEQIEFYKWIQEAKSRKGAQYVKNIIDYVNVTKCPQGHTNKEQIVPIETEIEYENLNEVTFTVIYVCHDCGLKLYSSSKTIITEKHILAKRGAVKLVNEILNGGTKNG